MNSESAIQLKDNLNLVHCQQLSQSMHVDAKESKRISRLLLILMVILSMVFFVGYLGWRLMTTEGQEFIDFDRSDIIFGIFFAAIPLGLWAAYDMAKKSHAQARASENVRRVLRDLPPSGEPILRDSSNRTIMLIIAVGSLVGMVVVLRIAFEIDVSHYYRALIILVALIIPEVLWAEIWVGNSFLPFLQPERYGGQGKAYTRGLMTSLRWAMLVIVVVVIPWVIASALENDVSAFGLIAGLLGYYYLWLIVVRVVYQRPNTLITQGKYDRALSYLALIMTIRPHDVAMLFTKGSAYSLKGDYERAITYLKQCIWENPIMELYALSLANIADAYMQLNDFGNALAAMETAIMIDPRISLNYANIAELYLRYDCHTDRALVLASFALEQHNSSESEQKVAPHIRATLLGVQAWAFAKLGRQQEAHIVLQTAWALPMPNRTLAFLNFLSGQVMLTRQDWKNAEHYFNEGFKNDPEGTNGRLCGEALADLQAKMDVLGRPADAEKVVTSVDRPSLD